MKRWLMERRTYGHVNLLAELRLNEPEDYKNFLRMDGDSFDELLSLVTPFIQKQDTMMRESISPLQRLSITLRYLATGNTFEDLKFISAISPQSIGRIVMETCEAIITCLKPYIKVRIICFQKIQKHSYCIHGKSHIHKEQSRVIILPI